MRFPHLIACLVAATVLSGCTGGGDNATNNSAQPTTSTVAAADVVPSPEPSPEPVETLDEEPGKDPKEPDPTDTPTEPTTIKTRSANPGVTLITPITEQLGCAKPRQLPSVSEVGGNEYPRIVFSAMCGAERPKDRKTYRFGQVGYNEGVSCGTEYIIDGNEPSGAAWYCPSRGILLTSPAAIRDNDRWQVMRELAIAYAMANVHTVHGSTTDLEKVACIIGRTILNLRVSGLMSTYDANFLMDDFTARLDNVGADALNFWLREGYHGENC